MAKEVALNNQSSKTFRNKEKLPVPCFYNRMKDLLVKKQNEVIIFKAFNRTCWFYYLHFMLWLSTMHRIIVLFIRKPPCLSEHNE